MKTRASNRFGYPEESVTPDKFEHLSRVAETFLAKQAWENRDYRIDVIAIRTDRDPFEIVHFKGVDPD